MQGRVWTKPVLLRSEPESCRSHSGVQGEREAYRAVCPHGGSAGDALCWHSEKPVVPVYGRDVFCVPMVGFAL
ncbi:hypothetical protein NDU88_004365 [Pleurodeles waltl]|uniref:Uncharacterized protein n=1 Tax=Pleurodeles waltl TaxID=8319 RepID=A0AAV7T7K9_PLEWA|nr:hypothetical protein NDU88_004365 [Pleurodeles waltl]